MALHNRYREHFLPRSITTKNRQFDHSATHSTLHDCGGQGVECTLIVYRTGSYESLTKIVGTDPCVCPPPPPQKGCLMVRLVFLTTRKVFTQEINFVIAVLLLLLSIAIVQLTHLSHQSKRNTYVAFNNPCYL